MCSGQLGPASRRPSFEERRRPALGRRQVHRVQGRLALGERRRLDHRQKTLEEETRRAQTAWLRPPPDPSVGDVDARRKLDGQLESLRETLIENSGAPLLRTMELSYAKYPVGGYYRRHIDVPRSVYYMLGRNGPRNGSAASARSYAIDATLSPENCICTMAWRFTKV